MGSSKRCGKTAEEIGLAILATLKARATHNREAGKVVREAIRQVLARPGSESLSARQVRALLRVDPLPSLRTVQWHLKAIRAT